MVGHRNLTLWTEHRYGIDEREKGGKGNGRVIMVMSWNLAVMSCCWERGGQGALLLAESYKSGVLLESEPIFSCPVSFTSGWPQHLKDENENWMWKKDRHVTKIKWKDVLSKSLSWTPLWLMCWEGVTRPFSKFSTSRTLFFGFGYWVERNREALCERRSELMHHSFSWPDRDHLSTFSLYDLWVSEWIWDMVEILYSCKSPSPSLGDIVCFGLLRIAVNLTVLKRVY